MSFLIAGTMVRDTTIPNGTGAYVVKPSGVVTDHKGLTTPNSSLAYFCDLNTRFEVWSHLLVSPWTLTQIGIDNMFPILPNGIAISPDDSTLYILCDDGSVYSLPSNATTNTAVLLGTLNNTDTLVNSWRCCWLDPNDSSTLLVLNVTGKKIYTFNLVTAAIGYYWQYWNTLLGMACIQSNSPSQIYIATAPSGQGAQNLLIKQYRGIGNAQYGGMHEVLAGNLVNGNTSGVAQQSQLAATKAMAADNDGNVYCYVGTAALRSVSAGQLATVTISGGTLGTSPTALWWQQNTNSGSGGYLIAGGGNNHIQVIA